MSGQATSDTPSGSLESDANGANGSMTESTEMVLRDSLWFQQVRRDTLWLQTARGSSPTPPVFNACEHGSRDNLRFRWETFYGENDSGV